MFYNFFFHRLTITICGEFRRNSDRGILSTFLYYAMSEKFSSTRKLV